MPEPIFTLRLWFFRDWHKSFRLSWRKRRYWVSGSLTRDWLIVSVCWFKVELSFNDSSEHYKRVKSWQITST